MLEMILYSAFAPVILLLVSTVVSYPPVLEEMVKWGVLKLTASGQQLTGKHGAMVGLVFGLSEAVLYLSSVWSSGQWQALGWRLILTVPMHAVTGSIIGSGMRKGAGWIALGLAMTLHAAFNYLVGLTR